MDRERQREIARKGGKAAHEKGTAHEFTADEARAAGRKGGERVSMDRSHMSRIGRLGGKRSAGRRSAKSSPDGGGENTAAPGTNVAQESSAPVGMAEAPTGGGNENMEREESEGAQ